METDRVIPASVEAVARRLYDDLWNDERYDVAGELFHPDFHPPGQPGLAGAAAKIAAIRGYRAAFPDLRITVDQVVVGVAEVAVRWTMTGTDTGGFRGRPATGKPVRAWGVDFLEFKDGRIVNDWVGADWLGVFLQLDVVTNTWDG